MARSPRPAIYWSAVYRVRDAQAIGLLWPPEVHCPDETSRKSVTLQGTMAIFYRGAGVGTYWHQHDPRATGFLAQSPGMACTLDALMQHIAKGTTASPYVSLTRSYGVALSYAYSGRAPATAVSPGYVYVVEINEPLPHNLTLLDPVREVANAAPPPLALVPYQHDGPQELLIALIDRSQQHRLTQPCPTPPGLNNLNRVPIITEPFNTLVFALRDAEILAVGAIPNVCVRQRLEVYPPTGSGVP